MDKHSHLALWLALALAGAACGDDPKPGSGNPTDDDGNPVDGDDDDDDDDEVVGGRSDGGPRGSRNDGGGSAGPAAGRDASGATSNRDAGSGNNGNNGGNRDAGGGNNNNGAPDAGGGNGRPTACDATKAPTIPPLALEPVVTGLSRLTFAAQPPKSSDWYFLQQGGQIRIATDGQLRPEPFLDFSNEVTGLMSGLIDDERGLLGIAFAPDYESSGTFYIMLTPTTGAGMNRDTVREYKRSAADPYKADPMWTKQLVQLPASAFNHDGGHVIIGPDGMLYVGTGDGGGSCNSDKRGEPQDPNSLFGKILRLDPKAAGPNYAAAGNPFASGGNPSVLHIGLRNPFRFSFDRMTGDLWIGDVGQDAYEEVSFVPKDAKGVNFGWPAFEGKHSTGETCARGSAPAMRPGSTHTPPVFEADQTMGSRGPYANWTSVMGGHVYRGKAIPQLTGTYIFGDYKGTRMVALQQCGDKTSPTVDIMKNSDPNSPNTPGFSRASGQPALGDLTGIVEDNDGELYLVANRDRLLKIVPRP